MLTILFIFIGFAIFFDFMNGFHDSSNIVSTMISSRALSPRQALTIVAIAEFIGPFIFGVAVAETIGTDILQLPADAREALPVIMAALISAVCWNVITRYFGIPSSSSHALMGGILGAGIAENAFQHLIIGISTINDFYAIFDVVKIKGLLNILTALVISPPLGFVAGYFLLKLVRFLSRSATPNINILFKKAQVVTAVGLALSHGTNDAQKTMGVITMGLLAAGVIPEFKVPFWVVFVSAFTIALGTSIGGWRLIKTLGGKFFKIRPVDGFTTQIGSAGVIFAATLVGGPVSTTQVVTSAIMGVGSAERLSKVRWGVGKQIMLTWLITLPSAAGLAGIFYLIIRSIV